MPHPSIASRRLLIEHSYRLVSDRATIIAHLIAYWKARGFNLSEDSDGSLCGTRGSYIANFTSFDSVRMMAK